MQRNSQLRTQFRLSQCYRTSPVEAEEQHDATFTLTWDYWALILTFYCSILNPSFCYFIWKLFVLKQFYEFCLHKEKYKIELSTVSADMNSVECNVVLQCYLMMALCTSVETCNSEVV
jgi:hypothetical protein